MKKLKAFTISAPFAIIALIVLIAVGGYLTLIIYQSKQVEQPTTNEQPTTSLTDNDTVTPSNTADASDKSDSTNIPDASDQTTICKKELKNNTTGEFILGNIIVGFKSEISYSQAEEIIKSYGLTAKKLSVAGYYGSLVVYVPEGTEFEWICKIKDNSNIKYAEVNYIVELNNE